MRSEHPEGAGPGLPDKDRLSSLPTYPQHGDRSPPAYPPDLSEIEQHRWSRVGRFVGRLLGGGAGGVAGAYEGLERWGVAESIALGVLAALVGGVLIGELAAFCWGLRGQQLGRWRMRLTEKRGDQSCIAEDPGWQAVHALMKNKRNSTSE